jgi:GT2 family glycosyltransferase
VDTSTLQAPPVVAVVVVHEPGDWFDEVLDSFVRQDYPNLRLLFLTTSEPGATEPDLADSGSADSAVAERVRARLDSAFVRTVDGNPGFGVVANEVLNLVEGDNGLFLICHDDVVMEPDAIRIMVEELYRSNAGAVGPKLVEWNDARTLQSVGLGLDRFGEVERVIEAGEIDQEQHDGVRDMFVLPSACLLVRADLFRELDGFDRAISFHGEDVELCWRIHHSGARVVVAPSARVRHRGELVNRRPDLNHVRLEAQHRMRTVATLTASSRMPVRVLEVVALTFVELVVGLFTATFGQAWASLRALLGLIPRLPSVLARRRAIKGIRRVPEREITGLQARGSARLNSFLRTRDTTTYVSQDETVRRWRDGTSGPIIAWLVVVLAVIVGSRSFFDGGIPAVGEFLPFPDSPRLLLDSFASGWNGTGAGATSPNPTGWATLAGLSVVTLFRMGLLQTVLTIGLVLLGASGMWKLATVFPSARARVGALLVYAATPLVGGAMAGGRLSVLITYAATPWIVHLLRRAVGIETADPEATAALDLVDGLVSVDVAERVRRIVVLGLVVALAGAFAPVVLAMTAALAVLLGLGTLVSLASWRTALWFAVAGLGAVAVAAALNLPWITTWSWAGIVGPSPLGDPGRGMFQLASFEIGPTDFAALALALYLPVIAAVALAKAWRLTWAVRAGVIVLTFGAIAVLGDRGSLPIDTPEAGILLVPVALGVAISAAAVLAAFDVDVRDGNFGWRQPLGIVAMMAIVVGLAPGVVAIGDGGWKTPTTTLGRLVNAWLADEPVDGDYRVLMVGDSRLLPVPSTEYRGGVSWALIDDGDLDFRDRWVAPDTAATGLINGALDEIATSSTLRAGRLLAPLGIRYVVLPEFDGVVSTTDAPIPIAAGLGDSLDDQLDLASITGGFPTLEIYENSAWLPTVSLLSGAAAEASSTAGTEALLRADLSESAPILLGADQFDTTSSEVTPGVVQLGVPFDEQWELTVDDEQIDARRSFGVSTAFDVPSAGTALLRYDTAPVRGLLIALQVVLWASAIFVALKIRVPQGRSSRTVITDETLIVLDEPSLLDPGLVPPPADRPAAMSSAHSSGDEVPDDEVPDDDGSDDDGSDHSRSNELPA